MADTEDLDVIRYVHGSRDSKDIDVIYVFDTLPSIPECKAFCDGKGEENGNIIVVRDGVTVAAFKGNADEVNNALFHTYSLHEQRFPLIIERAVERDVILKYIKVIRRIFSSLSRTQYRPMIKEALRSGWEVKLRALKSIDFSQIDFSSVKNITEEDLLKALAFQLGQAVALHEGAELYTKSELAEYFPELEVYLYRKSSSSNALIEFIHRFISILETVPARTLSDGTLYVGGKFDAVYDINKETRK